MSLLVTVRIAFPMFLLTTSQIPIGHTPGLLFSRISLQATKSCRLLKSNTSVHRRFARRAKGLHRPSDAKGGAQFAATPVRQGLMVQPLPESAMLPDV